MYQSIWLVTSSSLASAAAVLGVITAGVVFQSDQVTIIIIVVGSTVLVETRADNCAVACLLISLPPQSPVLAGATLRVRTKVFEAQRQENAGEEGGGDVESRSVVHWRGVF